ncbi:Cleavage polyadenylation factor subunit clp1, partial [Coemansia asiatica]
EWKLAPGQEFRFEVSTKSTITVKLKSGLAEYFGAELGTDAQYTFSGTNGAIFSWQGCVLEVSGECQSAYVAEETPMESYINVHMGLQQLRVQAHGEAEEGSGVAPRVMVVGPEDSGKTSLSRILLNYAVRMEETPLFVDLDPASASVAVPGTISATSIGKTIDIQDGFMGSMAVAGSSADHQPLVLQYGHQDQMENPVLFNLLVDKLASSIDMRLAADRQAAASGIIVDTHGSTDLAKLGFLEHAIKALGINVLLVVGNERMYSHFSSRVPTQTTVLKLAKSGGTVDRDANFRHQEQSQAIKQYFSGTTAEPRMSFSTVVNFADTRVLRVGEDAKAPSSTLPLGETRKLTDTSVVDVEIDEGLSHSVLAVTDVPLPNDVELLPVSEDVVGVQVLGFVNVTKVDMDKKRLTVTSPVPGRLPSNILLYSHVKWMEV